MNDCHGGDVLLNTLGIVLALTAGAELMGRLWLKALACAAAAGLSCFRDLSA